MWKHWNVEALVAAKTSMSGPATLATARPGASLLLAGCRTVIALDRGQAGQVGSRRVRGAPAGRPGR
jgi:hypothetical protein